MLQTFVWNMDLGLFFRHCTQHPCPEGTGTLPHFGSVAPPPVFVFLDCRLDRKRIHLPSCFFFPRLDSNVASFTICNFSFYSIFMNCQRIIKRILSFSETFRATLLII